MRWLIRQWHRAQLARELLEQYEWEEEHRVPLPEVLRRLNEYHARVAPRYQAGIDGWKEATLAKAEEYRDG